MKETLDAKDEIVAYIMNTEQGAATSVYAAPSDEWKSKGGRYLRKCVEQGPVAGAEADGVQVPLGDDGYALWAYDEASEMQLWRDSFDMLGLDDE